MTEVAITLMRGGTSKGVFLNLSGLPSDPTERDQFALRLMGSPDPMQIDGLGGTHSSTSKIVAVEARPHVDGLDIVYLFAQVGVDRPLVDWTSNCGNLTAAVGPYAIYEGLVRSNDPVTVVSLLNLNTNRRVTAHIATRDGQPLVTGDFVLAGVPGTSVPIRLDWHEPGGTVTGAVLPTGSPVDQILTSWGSVTASVVDVSGPYVFIDASTFGLTGTERSTELNGDKGLISKLMEIRAIVTERIGLAPSDRADIVSPTMPRVALVGAPLTYMTAEGACVDVNEYDVAARALSMGKMHHAFPGTGLLCLAAACNISGTTAAAATKRPRSGQVRIGHNKGVVSVEAHVTIKAGIPRVASVSTLRTARRLLQGTAFLD